MGSEARKRVQNGVAISLEGNLTKMQWNEMGPHLKRQLLTPVTGTCCQYCKERLIQRGRNKFRGFSTQLFCASTHISILSVSWELPTPNNRLVSPPTTKKTPRNSLAFFFGEVKYSSSSVQHLSLFAPMGMWTV